MNLYILNENLEKIGYIDSYESLEWVKRFNDVGDFVLVTAATKENMELLQYGNILMRTDDEQVCIIESINILLTSSEEKITVKGSAAENILNRRIIWTQTTAKSSETAENFIRRLITENAISPTVAARKINNIALGTRRGFTDVIEKQVTGDKLLTTISEICKSYNYGFKMTILNNKLTFNLYKGTDRSYKQSNNPYVVFSENFDNLAETEYQNSKQNYSNVALVGGEGEGTDRKYTTAGNVNATGLNRYEMFVDAKDISSNSGEITTTEYNNLLKERGKEKLAEVEPEESFEGLIDTYNTYIYKKDYFVGDIVQVENAIGLKAAPRITEAIESFNENGYKIVPKFDSWEV